ncbi:Battenin [Fasciolopsis buskii]|uniref:Battenin n=1 Tax=Fasciolopsis buskii TaxID=27845 RepID=A0A8E0RMC0_9TREM|nr:Battenin [Fasciolopsis buski]
MTAFFHKDCVSAWSSGTGAAGLVGALVYASLTTATSPETALLILTLVPVALVLV